ncbi:MAG: amino acid ABC transporter permease, partial [Alphaproteobacteria bacterium]|nr:amino acid ABC transporter permease [Alphaproteobacteria bacterium]
MTTASQRIDTAEVLRPPALETGPLGYIRKTFFSSWLNTIVTLVCLYTLWRLIPPIVEWAFINAVWTGNREMCRAAQAEGLAACWAFIGEKFEFMMFGFFPADDRWRPATMVGIFLSMIVASAFPKLWRRELFYAWVVALAVMYWLMAGGLGLTPVATKDWGGFALTLGVAVIAI